MQKITLNYITFIRSLRNYAHPNSFLASSTSTESSSSSKICTLLLNDPQISKLGFLCAKSTNCTIQRHGIAHVEIINNFLISRGHASQEKVDQIFVPKSKLGLLYTNFCIEVEQCLIFLYYCNVFLCTNCLTVTKELTEMSSVSSKIFFVKSFEYF